MVFDIMKGTIQYILILFFAYVYSEENSACGSCDRGKYRSNCTGGNQGVCVPCERCGEGEVRVGSRRLGGGRGGSGPVGHPGAWVKTGRHSDSDLGK